MIKINFIILILVSILFTSCAKDNAKNVETCDFGVEDHLFDYLIFGHFYGECYGENCVETFKLTDDSLFEDLNDSYAAQEPFDFIELDNEIFMAIKDLVDFFPPELLLETESIIGEPDSHDQGGIYIQYSFKDSVQTWRIDQDKNAIPEYLYEFRDKINEKIALINN